MKSIMLSTQPKWCELIASGQKTIEVRKSAPKEVPFKVYIYCAKGQELWGDGTGATWRGIAEDEDLDNVFKLNPTLARLNSRVIGEFICDKVYPIKNQGSRFSVADEEQGVTNEIAGQSCLYYDFGGKDGYGWHISDLKIYDKPRELSEFYTIDKSGDDCCIACVYHETPVEEMPCKTCTGERRYLYRPPQSWQYVEEVEQTI